MKSNDSRLEREVETASLRRQDLLCLFFYYCGISRIRNLVFRLRRMPIVRILAFHDVPFCQIRCFREKLEFVQKATNVISLDDIFAGRMSLEKINIVITFDDGYRSWLDTICPILRDLDLNATFFISSGHIGLREHEERDFLLKNLKSNRQSSGSLTAEGLRRLAEDGFAIGGHTCNHINMAEIDDINKLHYEVQKDKEELERISKTSLKYFAYPFGYHFNANIDLVGVLKKSGYQGAVTLVPGLITAGTDSFFLHRDLVNASMPMSAFKARLLGNYDAVMYVRKILRI